MTSAPVSLTKKPRTINIGSSPSDSSITRDLLATLKSVSRQRSPSEEPSDKDPGSPGALLQRQSLEPSPTPSEKNPNLDPVLFHPLYIREVSSSMPPETHGHSRSMITVTPGRSLTLVKQSIEKNAKANEKRFKLRDLSDEDRNKYRQLLEVVRMDYVQRGPDSSRHGFSKGAAQMERTPDYTASLEAFKVRYYSDQFFGSNASPMLENQTNAVCSWYPF